MQEKLGTDANVLVQHKKNQFTKQEVKKKS